MNSGEKVDMKITQNGTSEIDIRKIQPDENVHIVVDGKEPITAVVARRSMFRGSSVASDWIELRLANISGKGSDAFPDTIYLSQQLKNGGENLAPPIIVDPKQKYIGTVSTLERPAPPNIIQRLFFNAHRLVDEELLH